MNAKLLNTGVALAQRLAVATNEGGTERAGLERAARIVFRTFAELGNRELAVDMEELFDMAIDLRRVAKTSEVLAGERYLEQPFVRPFGRRA